MNETRTHSYWGEQVKACVFASKFERPRSLRSRACAHSAVLAVLAWRSCLEKS